MLTLEELVGVTGQSNEIGERPAGHYDHQSYCVVGPIEQGVMPAPTTSSRPTPVYNFFEDPDTGEILARPIVQKP